MQAITTLHAQICLATAKLDQAQKSLSSQQKGIRELTEEGRIKWGEVEVLTGMLQNIDVEARRDKEILESLKVKTLPLELECHRRHGALMVLPSAFEKLTDEFLTDSRRKMNKIDSLLSKARQENFWKKKIAMSVHHTNALRERLRQKTDLYDSALIEEECALNRQLAEEESSLAMVLSSIDAMERKNSQLVIERGDQNHSTVTPVSAQSFHSPRSTSTYDLLRGTNQDSSSGRTLSRNGARQTGSLSSNSRAPVLADETQSYESGVRCHGCHRYGHFVMDCDACYKCNRCGKHHLNGNPCPSNTFVGDAGKSVLRSASRSVERGDKDSHREYPVSQEHHTSARIADDLTLYDRFPYHIPDGVSITAPQNSQTTMRSRQIDGHVTHTVTHTVIEEVSESRPGVDGEQAQRDREMSAVDLDERPWFQLMKRRRSVTEVTQQKKRDDSEGNSYGEGGGSIYCEEDAGYKQLQSQRDPHSFHYDQSKEKKWGRASKVTPAGSAPSAKSNTGFRSGLQLLLESEK